MPLHICLNFTKTYALKSVTDEPQHYLHQLWSKSLIVFCITKPHWIKTVMNHPGKAMTCKSSGCNDLGWSWHYYYPDHRRMSWHQNISDHRREGADCISISHIKFTCFHDRNWKHIGYIGKQVSTLKCANWLMWCELCKVHNYALHYTSYFHIFFPDYRNK